MAKVTPAGAHGLVGLFNGQDMAGIRQTGKIGRSNSYGAARFGVAAFGSSDGFAGVYQKRVTGYNNLGRRPGLPRKTYYVRMKFYRPTNPNTENQQKYRGTFAEAVAAWPLLTESERALYNHRGKKLRRAGRNLFISERLKRNNKL